MWFIANLLFCTYAPYAEYSLYQTGASNESKIQWTLILFYSQSGFPLRYTENSHNPGQRVHQLHNHITTLLNIDCCTSLPVSSVYLSSSHHAHCGPWTSETTCSWSEVKKVSCQYLLIIHLSSEHLRSHPVGGANHSQRLLAFFLTAGKQEREEKQNL